MMRENVRFNQVGRAEGLPRIVLDEVNRTLEETAGNDGLVVTLALNYSSRAEIADACRAIAEKVAGGEVAPGEVDEALIDAHLYTAGTSGMATGIIMPDVDLLVRTAGELRVSNYLLWQISYAELWVTETLWPDFGRQELFDAIRAFSNRNRRYGALDPAIPPAAG
jgi:undecaprenyl diphosphate synthase